MIVGWYHQVYNEEDTLSINHNWFNAANIQTVLDNLDKELTRFSLIQRVCLKDATNQLSSYFCEVGVLLNMTNLDSGINWSPHWRFATNISPRICFAHGTNIHWYHEKILGLCHFETDPLPLSILYRIAYVINSSYNRNFLRKIHVS